MAAPKCPVHGVSSHNAYGKRKCRCEACVSFHRIYSKETRPKYAAYQKKWASENRDKTRASWFRWASKHDRSTYLARYNEKLKAKRRSTSFGDVHRLKRYGLTPEDYVELLQKQGGGCALCGSLHSQLSDKRRLSVDHDHGTGRVRGLLCYICNTKVVVVAEKFPHLFAKAIKYLEG